METLIPEGLDGINYSVNLYDLVRVPTTPFHPASRKGRLRRRGRRWLRLLQIRNVHLYPYALSADEMRVLAKQL